jgi:hypothetical protein
MKICEVEFEFLIIFLKDQSKWDKSQAGPQINDSVYDLTLYLFLEEFIITKVKI